MARTGPRGRGGPHFARWLLIAGAGAFCVVVLWLLMRSQPVQVTASRLEESHGQIYVAGQIRNQGDTASSVKLELHYFDQAGHPLGLDTISVDRLAAGSVRGFHGPPHDPGTIAAYSIYLNQGRNPYGN
jgi:hypothetical protein